MTNEVATFANTGNLPANPEDLAAGLQNVGMGIQSTSAQPILRLLREGIFVYGQENIEVEEGSRWAVNPYSIEHGFAAWGDGELLGEVMVPLTQMPPAVGTLPDHGVPWNQQISMQLQCMTGADKGVTVLYKSTSKGYMGMAKKLCAEIINQVQADPQHIVPLVELDMDYYTHKKYGKIYTPLLDVEEWLSIDTATPADDDDEDQAEAQTQAAEETPAKPRKGRRAKAASTEDDDTADDSQKEDAAPRRRRRRRG